MIDPRATTPFVQLTGLAANDSVLSPDGETLYVAGSDGKIRVYTIDTGALKATWSVGTSLGGMSVSPDGSFLVVTERQPLSISGNQYNVTTYRVDTTTGSVNHYDRLSGDYTFFDSTILPNGNVLLSQSYNGSSNVTMKTLDLASGVYTSTTRYFSQDGTLSETPDRARLLISGDYSGAQYELFQVNPAGQLSSVGVGRGGSFVNGIQAIARDGSFSAGYFYGGGLLVFDATMHQVHDVTSDIPALQYSRNVAGLTFDATGANLYILDGDRQRIIQISTATWATVKTIPLGASYTRSNVTFGNTLTMTPDGEWLVIATSEGVLRIDPVATTGTSGNDTLIGTSAINHLYGLAGNDTLISQAGVSVMIGGAGNDTYRVRSADDQVVEQPGDGIDTIESSVSYTLSDNVENLTLTGTGDIDAIGNALVNVLTGNSGANRLTNVGAGDTLIGGAGDDIYLVTDSSTVIVEGVGGGFDSIKTTVSYVLGAGVEVESVRLAAGSDNLNLTGNAFAQVLAGNSGNNVLDGGGGGDRMKAGAGDDTYIVRDAADIVVEIAGEGDDTVKAAVGFTLGAAAQVEHLWTLDATATTAINLTGNEFSHDIQGNAGVNVLTGGSGDDFLTGNGGADTLIGGLGNDTYLITDAVATIVEAAGEGNDRIKTTVSYVLAAGAEVETIQLAFGSAGTNLTGNAFSSKLIGNANDNVLDGGGGGDTLRGGLGNDTYIVRDASDRIVEANGEGTDIVKAAVSYTLTSDAYVETLRTIDASATTAINLTGNDHTTAIEGNAGANVLTGGAGNETISGFAGNDTLFGGGGNDTFVFGTGTGQDTVGDFVSGSDKLDLSAFFTSFSQVQAATHDVGGNAVIDLGGGDSVTLSGFLTAQLQSGDVIVGSSGAMPADGGVHNAVVSHQLVDAADSGDPAWHGMPIHLMWSVEPLVYPMV